jgi:carboxymethylenebutenolidase
MPIQTDSEGLDARPIKFSTADGELPGYQAMPSHGVSFPVVLVVQEIFGVNDYIQDVCRRLAKLGYLAVAPELYWRQGDVSKMTNLREITEKVVFQVPDSQVMSDLDAAADFAVKGRGDVSRIVIPGFCGGGRAAWLSAAHSDRLKAAGAWYARPPRL